MVTERGYFAANGEHEILCEVGEFFLWIFLACESGFLRVKMVGHTFDFNVERCEDFAQVRTFSVGSETALAEKAALHAALRKKCLGERRCAGRRRG
jgi:hypothetical protein